MPYLAETTEGSATLKVYVQPKGSKTKVVGLHDGRLKIAVSAPPVDGKANKELLSFLAKLLKVAKKDIVLKSGQQSRRKTVLISNPDVLAIRDYIERLL